MSVTLVVIGSQKPTQVPLRHAVLHGWFHAN